MKNVYQNQIKPHIVVSMSYLKVMEHAKNSWSVASSNSRWSIANIYGLETVWERDANRIFKKFKNLFFVKI
jgi:hypothetical protein